MYSIIRNLCCFICISYVASPAIALEVRLGSKFLDYGNGAINLDNVTHIDPNINYIITLADDELDTYFENYLSNNPRDLEDVKSWFDLGFNADPYYYFEISSDIKFDLFTLQILSTKRFAKLPGTPEEFEKIKDVNKFNTFLTKLELHLANNELVSYYSDDKITEFGERYSQVYSLLNTIAPQLSETGIDEVFTGLANTKSTYNSNTNQLN